MNLVFDMTYAEDASTKTHYEARTLEKWKKALLPYYVLRFAVLVAKRKPHFYYLKLEA